MKRLVTLFVFTALSTPFLFAQGQGDPATRPTTGSVAGTSRARRAKPSIAEAGKGGRSTAAAAGSASTRPAACASEAWISSPTTSWVTHGAPGSGHPSWRRFDAAVPVRLRLGRIRSARSPRSGRRSCKAGRRSFGAMLSERSCCVGRIHGAVLTKPRCSPIQASTSRWSVNRARKVLAVRAFRRGCGVPGGVSRQFPSLDGIHPRIGYLSTRNAEGKSPDGSLCYLDHRPDEGRDRALARASFDVRNGVRKRQPFCPFRCREVDNGFGI